MKPSLFLMLFVISFYTNAQKVIRGHVIDADSNGIPFATIEIEPNATTTNNQGFFELITPSGALTVKVRHVGFTPIIDTLRVLPDTSYMTFQLKPLELDSFTLKEKLNVDLVLDYEITQGVMYALIRRNRKKWIKAYDLEKTWLQTKQVANNVKELKKDCFGNVNVVSSQRVNQIFALKDSIIIIESYSISDFYTQIDPCEVSLDNRIVVSQSSQHNQQVIVDLFYQKVKKQLANIWDREASRNAAAYHAEIIRFYYKATPDYENIIELGVWDGDLVKLSVPFEILNIDGRVIRHGYTTEQIGWYRSVAARPLYCPVFGGDDGLFLFDFFNGLITHFDIDGKEIISTDISFHEEKDWLEKVIFDKVNNVFYTVYHVRNNYVLMEIDMETGRLSEVKPICQGCYPENVQVYDNEMYYVSNLKIRRVAL